jgi:hypothetical protein
VRTWLRKPFSFLFTLYVSFIGGDSLLEKCAWAMDGDAWDSQVNKSPGKADR